jgi:hypothetical protein
MVYSNLLDTFISYEAYKVMWIRPQGWYLQNCYNKHSLGALAEELSVDSYVSLWNDNVNNCRILYITVGPLM